MKSSISSSFMRDKTGCEGTDGNKKDAACAYHKKIETMLPIDSLCALLISRNPSQTCIQVGPNILAALVCRHRQARPTHPLVASTTSPEMQAQVRLWHTAGGVR